MVSRVKVWVVMGVGTSGGVAGLSSKSLGIMGVEAVTRSYAYDRRGDEAGVAFYRSSNCSDGFAVVRGLAGDAGGV